MSQPNRAGLAATDVAELDRPSPPRPGSPRGALDLAVVVPALNEAENILVLYDRLRQVLDGRWRWEMVVVDDDSADGTAARVEAAAQGGAAMRCLRRIGRRGLSSAVIEGCLATPAPLLAVMDADLQHDETVLPRMLEALEQFQGGAPCDLVVGTRYAGGGSTGEWDRRRRAASGLATWLSRIATPVRLSDPMSGFFAIRRDTLLECVRQLSGSGFKILLDIVCSAPRPLVIREVPYTFRLRVAGESKLTGAVMLDYLGLLVEKRTRGLLPAKFVLFGATGALGVLPNMLALWFGLRVLGLPFVAAQALAVWLSMTFNFAVNNRVTYGERRLRGGAALRGLLRFYVVCGIGAVANVGVGTFVFRTGSGWFLSGLAGTLVAAVFNFAMSSRFVWRHKPG